MSVIPRLAVHALVDWLCPPRCAACDRPLTPSDTLFCPSCWASVEPLDGRRCTRCGGLLGTGCDCRRRRPPFRSARSLFAYGGALAQAIRRFKYAGRLDLARPLGALLAPALASSDCLVVPIPSSPAALGRRGFDPVVEILRGLPGRRWAPLLGRVDDRPAQASLSADERLALGPGAFRVRRAPGHSPLCLVDDVLTTGATARAAAAALRLAGVRAVDVITLARSESP